MSEEMAMSDAKLLEDLTARVEVLEDLVRGLLPRDMQGELYGAEVDHTEDRAARAAIGAERLVEPSGEMSKRGPGRPPLNRSQ